MEGITLGQIVHSKAGRDKGKYFIVVSIVDENFIMMADGDLRKIENPKMKKVKHLVLHKMFASEIQAALAEGKPILDAQLRNGLQSIELL
jgi:large subunit ribosomal protein L14e